jgi:hypothetical protein
MLPNRRKIAMTLRFPDRMEISTRRARLPDSRTHSVRDRMKIAAWMPPHVLERWEQSSGNSDQRGSAARQRMSSADSSK